MPSSESNRESIISQRREVFFVFFNFFHIAFRTTEPFEHSQLSRTHSPSSIMTSSPRSQSRAYFQPPLSSPLETCDFFLSFVPSQIRRTSLGGSYIIIFRISSALILLPPTWRKPIAKAHPPFLFSFLFSASLRLIDWMFWLGGYLTGQKSEKRARKFYERTKLTPTRTNDATRTYGVTWTRYYLTLLLLEERISISSLARQNALANEIFLPFSFLHSNFHSNFRYIFLSDPFFRFSHLSIPHSVLQSQRDNIRSFSLRSRVV